LVKKGGCPLPGLALAVGEDKAPENSNRGFLREKKWTLTMALSSLLSGARHMPKVARGVTSWCGSAWRGSDGKGPATPQHTLRYGNLEKHTSMNDFQLFLLPAFMPHQANSS